MCSAYFGCMNIAVSVLLKCPIILSEDEPCKDDSFVTFGSRLQIIDVVLRVRSITNDQER